MLGLKFQMDSGPDWSVHLQAVHIRVALFIALCCAIKGNTSLKTMKLNVEAHFESEEQARSMRD